MFFLVGSYHSSPKRHSSAWKSGHGSGILFTHSSQSVSVICHSSCKVARTFSSGLYHNLTTFCLAQGLRLDTAWLSLRGCIVGIPEHNLLAITFAYTTCFNFVLLLVAGWGFASSPSSCTSSHVLKILFDDGLVFFSAA